ncbi:hypothetical protein TWF481_010196 [Arthrobotrys musiformis]|uniref:Nucleolar pre-ribosomal-associated protein 1 N-terminal domain-containing protein n=1 Tax=Arthrobotrys musiformis TaxID=47236 RepID=A0AAV9W2W4_9PEZI
MAKRPFNQANVEGQDRRPGNTSKRQKKDDSAPAKGLAPETITSARQVQGLFSDYSNAAKIQAGIQSFKKFLAECRDLQYALHIDEEIKLCILQEYLESQISKDGDETCADLLQAWSYASQSNNFQLLSSIPTTFHLLIRTISLFPAWKKHGVALAKSVLQPSYLKLIYRSLGGSKDAISSPSLRLLTEINKFDNGSLCPFLHQSLDFTVKDLARNLEVKKTEKPDHVPVEDPDRPSVRTVFIRFILSFFRHGAQNIKTDIMGLRTFTTPLFKYIRQDTAVVIDEVLTTFRECIISDQDISRSAKTNYFNDWSLSRLAELCYRDDDINPEIPDRTVADVAFEFLGGVCTTPGNGVCFKDNGWYNGSKPDTSDKSGKQNVNNRILLGLLKSLRPYSNTYHLRLLIAVFTAAPELVAAYFNDNTAFTFDPKLTATWIGLSSVVLETIQIPVPEGFGYSAGEEGGPSAPPPVRNSMENILPQQVNRAVLTKCLGFNNNFVRFIAVRILNAAFAKLVGVLEKMGQIAEDLVDGSAWGRGVYDLIDEFSKRVPEVGTVVAAFNQMKEDAALQREAGSRLLRNYYEYLPSAVGGVSTGGKSGFDFGPAFGKVLVKIGESRGFEALEVKHCLHLAKLLPETRWWAKPAAAKYSPAITLMKVFTEGNGGERTGDVYGLLEKIVDDSSVFGKNGKKGGVHPLEALMETFECVRGQDGWERVLGYLDNACGRLVQGPYKYFDIVGEALEKVEGGRGLSPLLAALFHQFNFLKKEEEKREELEGLCKWLLSVANSFWVIGEIPMIQRDGVDIAGEVDGASEVFTQFVGGVKAWRRCLEDFKLGKSGSSGFLPLEFELPDPKTLTSKSGRSQDAKEKYAHLYTLAEAVKAQPAVTSFYYWKWIQHILDLLLRSTSTIDESLDSDSSALEVIYNTILGAYEDAARKLLKNDAYDVDSRPQKCLDFMVDAEGRPYLEYFATGRRLMSRFDNALINIYTLLPTGTLDDNDSIKSQLFKRLLQSSTDSKSTAKLSTFVKQLLDISDLKKCCRDAKDIDLPEPTWRIIFERLNTANETLADEEIWTLICGGKGLNHPWVSFTTLLKPQSALKTSIPFEVVNGVVMENSSVAFSKFLLLLLQNGMEVARLLDTIDGFLADKPLDEITNLAFPVCKAIKDLSMGRDDSTGRLRWKKRGAEEMQIDEVWKEGFIQSLYLNQYSGIPLHQAVLENRELEGGLKTEYILIGLEFGVITWSERVLGLLNLDDGVSSCGFELLDAAYRLSQGSDMAWFHGKLQKMVYALTVRLSERGGDGEGLEGFGEFLGRNEVDLLDYVAKEAVDALLEVVFERLGSKGVVDVAAGVIGGVEDVKYLQHSKLLQLLLTTPSALSTPRDPSRKEETYKLAYILHKLFFASKQQHSNITTLDGVLSLYGGTNDVVDEILLEILMTIEQYTSRSILDRISAVQIGDDKKFVERDGKGQLKIYISPSTAEKSIHHPHKRAGVNTQSLKKFLDDCKKVDEGGREGYNLTFLSGIIMNSLTTENENQKLDIKNMISQHLLGAVMNGLSSDIGEERGMAEAILTTVVSKLEVLGGGGRGYKERIEVLHLLCKILTGIVVLEEGKIPTITTHLLAGILEITSTPSHAHYEKVMTYLQSRPTLSLTEIPLLKEFLRTEGEKGYWKEKMWIVDGLKCISSPTDVEILRKRGVFEELLGLYPTAGEGVKRAIAEVLWNTAAVEGGATTLITRTGVVSWVKMMICAVGAEGEEILMLKRLAARLWEGCDKAYVRGWSEGNIGRVLEGLVGL